jgi:hypothetical protein
MSALYTKSRQEAKKVQEEGQIMEANEEWERKVAKQPMGKYFEHKFNEFTKASQTKLTDERLKRLVRSLDTSQWTPSLLAPV